AQLLEPPSRRNLNRARRQPRHAAYRGALQPVWWSSRPRVSRWPPTNRTSLLHERCGAVLHPEEGIMRKLIISACLAGALSALPGPRALAAAPLPLAPAPALDAPLAKVHGAATAILSGGCFWGMQDVFQHVKGVKEAVSGYTGGTADT